MYLVGRSFDVEGVMFRKEEDPEAGRLSTGIAEYSEDRGRRESGTEDKKSRMAADEIYINVIRRTQYGSMSSTFGIRGGL